jgi:hypothetical protein
MREFKLGASHLSEVCLKERGGKDADLIASFFFLPSFSDRQSGVSHQGQRPKTVKATYHNSDVLQLKDSACGLRVEEAIDLDRTNELLHTVRVTEEELQNTEINCTLLRLILLTRNLWIYSLKGSLISFLFL